MNPLLLFWLLLKGSLFSTGGMGNVPILHADLLARGWSSDRQFAESMAIGQITPGPNGLWVISLGYLVGGVACLITCNTCRPKERAVSADSRAWVEAFLARGGEVFVTKMPVARIADLARVMIDELAPRYGRDPRSIDIRTIGVKAGEKLYEELMNDEETRRTVELDRYFSVIPAFKTEYQSITYDYPGVINARVSRAYNSALEAPLSVDQLRSYLQAGGLLEPAL